MKPKEDAQKVANNLWVVHGTVERNEENQRGVHNGEEDLLDHEGDGEVDVLPSLHIQLRECHDSALRNVLVEDTDCNNAEDRQNGMVLVSVRYVCERFSTLVIDVYKSERTAKRELC